MATKVDIPVESIIRDIQEWVTECSGVVVNAIAEKAIQNSYSAFDDKTGNLRKSIIAQKSKFNKNAWIVGAMAPHAHLIEFGHIQTVSKKRGPDQKKRKKRGPGGNHGKFGPGDFVLEAFFKKHKKHHIPARPFFIPAVLAVAGKIDTLLANKTITIEVKK